jgi:hypothetical protein
VEVCVGQAWGRLVLELTSDEVLDSVGFCCRGGAVPTGRVWGCMCRRLFGRTRVALAGIPDSMMQKGGSRLCISMVGGSAISAAAWTLSMTNDAASRPEFISKEVQQCHSLTAVINGTQQARGGVSRYSARTPNTMAMLVH